jgi:hypothetical protein
MVLLPWKSVRVKYGAQKRSRPRKAGGAYS